MNHFSRNLLLWAALLLAPVLAAQAQPPRDQAPSLAPMLEDVTPAVVNIAVTRSRNLRERIPEELRRFFEGPGGGDDGEPPVQRSRGAGSGVIVDAEQGYVVTNHHVVAEADSVQVGLQDGRQFDAEVVGSDERTEIALLQIDADDLAELEFADIDDVRVGDYVVAIGNPFGIGQTATQGIVSAMGRAGINPENYEDFIQTDAAINVGNSGGALVNMNGQLIGINTAIISGSGTSAGVGFAVPADMASIIVERLREDGVVNRGQLGVLIRDYSPAMEEAMNLGTDSGALVTRVVPGSGAEEAGIQVSDVIVSIDGESVDNARDLRNAVGLTRVNEEVELVLYRDGERQTVAATIRGDQDQEASADDQDGSEGRSPNDSTFFGARLRTAPSGDGVEVVDVQERSRAAAAGLQPGDLIFAVNRNEISNLREFNELASGESSVTALGIERDGEQALIVLP